MSGPKGGACRSLGIKKIRDKVSCSCRVNITPFEFFKLLKFIIVSFHLALTRFVLKSVSGIFLFIYIFIWFEYMMKQYVSLWSSYRHTDGRLKFSRNQKKDDPEVFL